MTTTENRYTSGLVFLASRNCDTLDLSASLQRVLEANGHRICGVQVLSDSHVQVTSDILTLELSVPMTDDSADQTTQANPDQETPQDIMAKAGLVIEVSLSQPVDSGTVPAKRATQATLASLTCQMAVWLEPDYIRWLNEDTLLDTADFVKAVARVMPRRVKRKAQHVAPRPAMPAVAPQPQPQLAMAHAGATPIRPVHPTGTTHSERPAAKSGAMRFPDVDMTSRRLEQEYDSRNRDALDQSDLHELSDLRSSFRQDEDEERLESQGIAAPRNSVARMATWFVAITVGIFSLPLAAFLMVYNLFRGEDFRLSAQTLSLTGLFAALNANGATAQVMDIVHHIVG